MWCRKAWFYFVVTEKKIYLLFDGVGWARSFFLVCSSLQFMNTEQEKTLQELTSLKSNETLQNMSCQKKVPWEIVFDRILSICLKT